MSFHANQSAFRMSRGRSTEAAPDDKLSGVFPRPIGQRIVVGRNFDIPLTAKEPVMSFSSLWQLVKRSTKSGMKRGCRNSTWSRRLRSQLKPESKLWLEILEDRTAPAV